jgi:hypothetical protein
MVRVDLSGDVLQLVLAHLKTAILVYLIALDDVFVGYLFASVSIDLEVANPVPSLLIDLIETDLRIPKSPEIVRSGMSRATAAESLPIGAWGHEQILHR